MTTFASPVKAIFLTCIGYFLFTFSDAAIKALTSSYSLAQILAFSAALNILFCLAYKIVTKSGFYTNNLRWHVLRGGATLAMLACTTYALTHTQMTTFYAFIFTSPFWVLLLSWLLLKDKLYQRHVITILIGFAAVLFMLRPSGGVFSIGALSALGSGFFFSLNLLLIYKMGPNENRILFVLFSALANFIVMVPLGWSTFVMPGFEGWMWFLALSGSTCVGLLFISRGMQLAPVAATVAPFHYTQMIYGAILGLVLFRETPDVNVIIGGAVLIATGIYLIDAEHRAKLKAVNQSRESF